jgi:site-specific DNA-cytosine methylase
MFDHDTEKPVKIRSLTIQETLILQGFNPKYKLDTAKTQKNRWTLIGNAVPPPVAQAVIEGISQQVECTDTLNDSPLLGESSGLCAD